jgi:hypothetical protein
MASRKQRLKQNEYSSTPPQREANGKPVRRQSTPYTSDATSNWKRSILILALSKAIRIALDLVQISD